MHTVPVYRQTSPQPAVGVGRHRSLRSPLFFHSPAGSILRFLELPSLVQFSEEEEEKKKTHTLQQESGKVLPPGPGVILTSDETARLFSTSCLKL